MREERGCVTKLLRFDADSRDRERGGEQRREGRQKQRREEYEEEGNMRTGVFNSNRCYNFDANNWQLM